MTKSIVAIVTTGVRPSYQQVLEAVKRSVTLAGGLESAASPGGLVLIKPNLVAPPPSAESGACTSANVCRALYDVVADLGGRPVIAESSARGVDTEAVMRLMGYSALRDRGYQVVDLKQTPTVKVPVLDGHVLDQVTTYELAMEAEAIISVPVMKTHDQTDVTLSLKNLKGLVIDAEKRRIHQLGLFEGVSDLAGLFRPAYALVDGIIGQEGLGPVYGLPVRMGLLVAGADPLSVDGVASEIMGFDRCQVRLLRIAEERGVGILDPQRVQVVGERIEDVRRRFMRMEEDERIKVQGVRVLHDEESCTGCRNGQQR